MVGFSGATSRIAPSRQGKRQVIAYLEPSLADSALAYAYKHNKTLQEVIADAINAELARRGHPPLMSTIRQRVIRRRVRRAAIRNETNSNCSARVGKKSFSGWFYVNQVTALAAVAKAEDCTIQNLLEEGVRLLVSAPPPEEENAQRQEEPTDTK